MLAPSASSQLEAKLALREDVSPSSESNLSFAHTYEDLKYNHNRISREESLMTPSR